jgi:heme/copper-type cytochrome/quinol oxidase subunit 2
MKNKFVKGAAVLSTLASLALAGCGQATSSQATNSDQAKPAANSSQTTTPAPASDKTSNTSQQQVQNVYLVIEAGAKLGPDGKLHDAFINGDFTVTAGKPVHLTIYNYDDGTHTLTAGDLGLNVKVKGSEKKGQPGVTEADFTPTKEGTFNWLCADKCDGQNNQWAMTHDGYMQGKITVVKDNVQHVSLVVNAGLKLGPDGKQHDAFTPGDFTINANEPVELTIYNFDDGTHTLTSKDLGVNVKIDGSKKKGDPGVTTYKFTPTKTGTFMWNCADKCDGENGQWAMAHDDYMMGKVTVK